MLFYWSKYFIQYNENIFYHVTSKNVLLRFIQGIPVGWFLECLELCSQEHTNIQTAEIYPDQANGVNYKNLSGLQ